jgi:hypothetical protein
LYQRILFFNLLLETRHFFSQPYHLIRIGFGPHQNRSNLWQFMALKHLTGFRAICLSQERGQSVIAFPTDISKMITIWGDGSA